ncbi:MAG TPA: hypothetical protein VGR45_16510 [Stellaceae bacterium]|nr:hypothetical protein [Stellaceae bacterium]
MGHDDQARRREENLDLVAEPQRLRVIGIDEIERRRIAKIDADAGTARGGDNLRPLRVRNGVHGLGERDNDLRKKCRRKPGPKISRDLQGIKAGVLKPGIDNALQRGAKAHCDDDRQRDGHRDAVEAPASPHGVAPEAVTATAK